MGKDKASLPFARPENYKIVTRISETPKKGDHPMHLIKAIVRPERTDRILSDLMEAGFPAVTKFSVVGRGKQRGIKIGDITYDELQKDLLFTVVKDTDCEYVIRTIMKAARSGDKGAFGDGKIFVTPIVEAYTISSGIKESPDGGMEEVQV